MAVAAFAARPGHGVATKAVDSGATGRASSGGGAAPAGRQALAGGGRAALGGERSGRDVLEAAVGSRRLARLAPPPLSRPAVSPYRSPVATTVAGTTAWR